jgi:hypothetical protein
MAFGFSLIACHAPKLPPPPIPTPAATIAAEDLPTPRWLELGIIDLAEHVSADRSRVAVSGVLVNRGNRATVRVSVRVEGLDAAGRTIVSADAVPSSERLAANGGTARFAAELRNDPAVERYHVKALAQ